MEILKVLEDKKHTEIFMGGAAGGSKSFTGCLWQILRRRYYAGSRGFIARARLKTLKESTLLTFFDVCRKMGLQQGKDYTYNAVTGLIKFSNGSEEYLRDLFYYPSDPEFVSLGSTEYTDGFIDEMAEITEQAYQIIRSRMRYKLDDFGLIPKIAMGSNPCKTFIYKEFYRKWTENKLEPYKAYIFAGVYDNPFISDHYIENLKKLDPINKARLLDGNWEYDDDPTKLFEYDAILDLFTNEAERGDKYCTVDVAGRGRDRTVVMNWDGLFITKIILMDNISSEELDAHLTKHNIPRSHCIGDEDGVGFGLVKDTKGIKGFINNGTPIKRINESDKEKVLHNYANLKAQCWFELSNYVNSGLIGIYRDVEVETKRILIEDLEQIKQKDPGKDQPLRILTKEEIKEVIGRSTDVGDAMMMRMYFTLNKPMAMGFISITKTAEKSKQQTDREKKQKEEKEEEIKQLVASGQISFAPTAKGKKEKEIQANNKI
jgi:phage terminase large subunit